MLFLYLRVDSIDATFGDGTTEKINNVPTGAFSYNL